MARYSFFVLKVPLNTNQPTVRIILPGESTLQWVQGGICLALLVCVDIESTSMSLML